MSIQGMCPLMGKKWGDYPPTPAAILLGAGGVCFSSPTQSVSYGAMAGRGEGKSQLQGSPLPGMEANMDLSWHLQPSIVSSGSPALTCHPSPAQGRPHFHREGTEGDTECQARGHCAISGWRRPDVWSRPGTSRGGLGGCAHHCHGDLRCPQLPCSHQGRKAGHPAQDNQVSSAPPLYTQ